MAKYMAHIGSGPRYGHGRKRLVQMRWTRNQVALTFAFLILVAVTVIVGMYFGWLSSQGEEQTNSPESKVSDPHK